MKVKDLIDTLKKSDPEALVVMSADSEGNGYLELRVVNFNSYNFDERNAEIGLRELTPEYIKEGYTEEDLREDGIPAVVLWP